MIVVRTAEKIRDIGEVGTDLRGDLDRGQSGPGAREALSVQSAPARTLGTSGFFVRPRSDHRVRQEVDLEEENWQELGH